ncbi:MAG: hypothetical protein HZB65_00500 [Candidatus Aenigmarchaeota archaeon]|nr:hypothetical protein [Candidatus Aenigmarchaeota archaeon]
MINSLIDELSEKGEYVPTIMLNNAIFIGNYSAKDAVEMTELLNDNSRFAEMKLKAIISIPKDEEGYSYRQLMYRHKKLGLYIQRIPSTQPLNH